MPSETFGPAKRKSEVARVLFMPQPSHPPSRRNTPVAEICPVGSALSAAQSSRRPHCILTAAGGDEALPRQAWPEASSLPTTQTTQANRPHPRPAVAPSGRDRGCCDAGVQQVIAQKITCAAMQRRANERVLMPLRAAAASLGAYRLERARGRSITELRPLSRQDTKTAQARDSASAEGGTQGAAASRS